MKIYKCLKPTSVYVSVHCKYSLTERAMTKHVSPVMEHPHVTTCRVSVELLAVTMHLFMLIAPLG